MGNCCSSEGSDKKAQAKTNKKINQALRDDKRELDRTVKLLVLGAGESGKSTLVRQMKIIHGGGYHADELREYVCSILENIRDSMCNLTAAMNQFGYEYENPDCKQYALLFKDLEAGVIDEQEDFTPEMKHAAEKLWADAGIQKAYLRQNEFVLVDSAKYYLDDLDRITDKAFQPSTEDFLRVRVRTTGILETSFDIDDLTYKMVDVGGQRSERRKWIKCFDDVTAIIFVAALSGYDMVLFEDTSCNRLDESIKVFSEHMRLDTFENMACILFLNKLDLFRAKIPHSPLKKYQPAFDGPEGDEEAAQQFIKQQFENNFGDDDERSLFAHFTTATDRNNIEVVFRAVNQIIVEINLKACFLI